MSVVELKDERLEQWRNKRRELNDLIREIGQYVGQGGAGQARAPHSYITEKGTVVQRGRGSFKPKQMYEKEMPKPSGTKPVTGGVRGAMGLPSSVGGTLAGGAQKMQPGTGPGTMPSGAERPSVQEGLPQTGITDPVMESFVAVHGMDTYNTIRGNIMNADMPQIQQMMQDAKDLPEESITRIGLERLLLVELNDRFESGNVAFPEGYGELGQRQRDTASEAFDVQQEEIGRQPERERATITDKPKEKMEGEADVTTTTESTTPVSETEPKPEPQKYPLPTAEKRRERRIIYQTMGEDVSRVSGMPEEEMAKYRSLGEGQIWSDELVGHEPGQIVEECSLGMHKHGDTWGGKCHPAEVNHRKYRHERVWQLEEKLRAMEAEFDPDNATNRSEMDTLNKKQLEQKIDALTQFKQLNQRTYSEVGEAGTLITHNQMNMRADSLSRRIQDYGYARDKEYENEFKDGLENALANKDSMAVRDAFRKYFTDRLGKGMFWSTPDITAQVLPMLQKPEIGRALLTDLSATTPEGSVGYALGVQIFKNLREMYLDWTTDEDAANHDATEQVYKIIDKAIDNTNALDPRLAVSRAAMQRAIDSGITQMIYFSMTDDQIHQLINKINVKLGISAPASQTSVVMERVRERLRPLRERLDAAIASNDKKAAQKVLTDMRMDWGNLEHWRGMNKSDNSQANLRLLLDAETEASDFVMESVLKYHEKFDPKATIDDKPGSPYFTQDRMKDMSNRALWKIAQFMGWGGAYRSKPELIADISKGVNPAGYEKKMVKVGNFLEHFTKMDEEDVEATWAVAMQAGQTLWVQALEAERDRRYAIRRLQDPNAPPPQWNKDLMGKVKPKNITNLGGWMLIDASDFDNIADPGVRIGGNNDFSTAVEHQHVIQRISVGLAQSGRELMRLVRTGGREVTIDANGQNHETWSKENKGKMREWMQQNFSIVVENRGTSDAPSYDMKMVNIHTGEVAAGASGIRWNRSARDPLLPRNPLHEAEQEFWHWGDAWANPMFRGIGMTSDCFVTALKKAERDAGLKKARRAGLAGTEEDIARHSRPFNMDSTMITIGSQKFSGPSNIIAGTPLFLKRSSESYVTSMNRYDERAKANSTVYARLQDELSTISATAAPGSMQINEWRDKVKEWQESYHDYLREAATWEGKIVPGAASHYIDLVGNGLTNTVGLLMKVRREGHAALTPTEKKHLNFLKRGVDQTQVQEKRQAFRDAFFNKVNDRLDKAIEAFKSGDKAAVDETFRNLKSVAFGKIEMKEHIKSLQYEALQHMWNIFHDTRLSSHLGALASVSVPSEPVEKASEEDIRTLLKQETYSADSNENEMEDDFWADIDDMGEDDFSTLIDIPNDSPLREYSPGWKDSSSVCGQCHRYIPGGINIFQGDPICPRCASMIASSNLDQDMTPEMDENLDELEKRNGVIPPNKEENLKKLHDMFGDIQGAP